MILESILKQKHWLLLSLLIQFVGNPTLQARKIDAVQARQKAYAFWKKSMPKKARTNCCRVAMQDDCAYYIFNNEDGGFVIISGDDAVRPVLGYTHSGRFDADSIPDGLKVLLDCYKEQISQIRADAPAYDDARSGFKGKRLLRTAKWNQWYPYNKYVPKGMPTGCVPTAAAIIMKYHGYPQRGIGNHSYYWNDTLLSANFDHTYDWDDMPEDGKGTEEQMDKIARLMSDLGVAVETKYSEQGSGAGVRSMLEVLKNNFKYSKSATHVEGPLFKDEEWKSKLRREINANRPVLYHSASIDNPVGHAFVIDGYEDDAFSVNWGWGGSCDGIYFIDALNPEDFDFNGWPGAVFSLKPSGTDELWASFSSTDGTLSFYYNAAYNPDDMIYSYEKKLDEQAWSRYCYRVEKVVFDESMSELELESGEKFFNSFSSLTRIEGIRYLNTSRMKTMSDMFAGCSSLSSLDVSGFDTRNVTNMSGMFDGCSSLSSLDVSGFDTRNVTNMQGMFVSCSSLSSLDVSGFDTRNVTNMRSMFGWCSSLSSLGVSGFDTRNVTDMRTMFAGCSSFSSLDVSSFNTSNVTDMSYLFSSCSALSSLDFSGFDTRNVTDMSGMFADCSSLSSIDVTGLDTRNVTDMTNMFGGCSSLTSLDVSSFDTRAVRRMGHMFSGCSSLVTLDLSGFNTNNVANNEMYGFFSRCSSLVTIYVSENFVVPSSTYSNNMFDGCVSLRGAIAYDEEKTEDRYANYVDGYFTYKSNASSVGHPVNEDGCLLQRKSSCFDLLGRSLAKPQRGVILKNRGNRVYKVLVR